MDRGLNEKKDPTLVVSGSQTATGDIGKFDPKKPKLPGDMTLAPEKDDFGKYFPIVTKFEKNGLELTKILNEDSLTIVWEKDRDSLDDDIQDVLNEAVKDRFAQKVLLDKYTEWYHEDLKITFDFLKASPGHDTLVLFTRWLRACKIDKMTIRGRSPNAGLASDHMTTLYAIIYLQSGKNGHPIFEVESEEGNIISRDELRTYIH
jgi:hypothetical protein